MTAPLQVQSPPSRTVVVVDDPADLETAAQRGWVGVLNSQVSVEATASADRVIVWVPKDAAGARRAAEVATLLTPSTTVEMLEGRAEDTLTGHLRRFDMDAAGRVSAAELDNRAGPPAGTANPKPQAVVQGEETALPALRRWSMSELLAEPDALEWLILGMLCQPTYGMVAGELKSLKTYLTAMIQVGLAAGVPILGHFAPPAPMPVVAYVGEGGRRPYVRRLRHIARSMGVDLGDIPLYIVTDVAPIQSDIFACTLQRDLAEIEPALVTLDPYYAYHGAKTQASNLHEEGALLTGLSSRCVNAGASLLVVNHMNQTGAGRDLKRITMAGGGEWVDSWLLVGHREAPDVEAGQFKLWLDVGSRQWGGNGWDLDLNIGRFDEETGTHDGDITWDLRRTTTAPAKQGDDRDAETKLRILAVINDLDGPGKAQVLGLVGGNKDRFYRCWDQLASAGRIAHNGPDPTAHTGGRPRLRWHETSPTSQSIGKELTEDEAF